MKTYRAGQMVEYGLYFATKPPDLCFVGADGERIEGASQATYRRLPTVLAIAASPVIGGAFVLAFPFLVLAAPLVALGVLVRRWARKHLRVAAGALGERYSRLAAARWEPTTAYLTDAPPEPGADAEEAGDDAGSEELAALRAQVDRKRDEERRGGQTR